MRLLIVEDEPKLAQSISDGLRAEGYEVAIATSGEEAFVLTCTESFDLIVLDRMLPGREGVEVLALLRQQGITTPTIVVHPAVTAPLVFPSLAELRRTRLPTGLSFGQ